jgi:hypothetical protein
VCGTLNEIISTKNENISFYAGIPYGNQMQKHATMHGWKGDWVNIINYDIKS